ncbi:hypothetical protein O6H91_18G021900 [Diphasiastrum complanatum]|uniref:Uncharacterized protein n=1 Tax=Diphasiastrum complanatum TaxID=34168 RepID=A0ACC2AYS7_DIPCM|nr:hypothetical protein O6H91_Y337100 [Diphasiastrum complanatum]KAJ7522674.1 hypothetical protein O6H91_18G021900 [Diphasiastrum complanatum]
MYMFYHSNSYYIIVALPIQSPSDNLVYEACKLHHHFCHCIYLLSHYKNKFLGIYIALHTNSCLKKYDFNIFHVCLYWLVRGFACQIFCLWCSLIAISWSVWPTKNYILCRLGFDHAVKKSLS